MTKETIDSNGCKITIVNSDVPIIIDGQTALELAINIGHECDCQNIAIRKEAIAEVFFNLSTGIAGEVVQKFVNYGYRLAIFGDFSGYTSSSLKDYIFECNNGKHLYFAADEEEAIMRLSKLNTG